MYDLVGGGRFFGGFQNFLVNIEGVSKFCMTQGRAQIYLAMINLDDLGERQKLTRLRTTSTVQDCLTCKQLRLSKCG